MFGQTSALVDRTSEDTETKQIADFNESFDSYNKKLMYGTDVISVLNKAIDNNRTYGVTDDPSSEYYVDIAFRLKRAITETNTLNTDIYALSTKGEQIKNSILINRNGVFSEFKRRAFQCKDIDGDRKNVTYNNSGRICKLEFEEVEKQQILN